MILAEEVGQTIRALYPLANQKNISIRNICSNDVVINADKNMLREVLINLIDNSVKYGSDNGFVEIGCNNESFWVKDNGCGIPEQKLQTYLTAFRIDRSRAGESGSGIGLFIVKRIIEMHGFKISVSSKPGEGSVFTVEFANT